MLPPQCPFRWKTTQGKQKGPSCRKWGLTTFQGNRQQPDFCFVFARTPLWWFKAGNETFIPSFIKVKSVSESSFYMYKKVHYTQLRKFNLQRSKLTWRSHAMLQSYATLSVLLLPPHQPLPFSPPFCFLQMSLLQFKHFPPWRRPEALCSAFRLSKSALYSSETWLRSYRPLSQDWKRTCKASGSSAEVMCIPSDGRKIHL